MPTPPAAVAATFVPVLLNAMTSAKFWFCPLPPSVMVMLLTDWPKTQDMDGEGVADADWDDVVDAV